MRSGAQWLRISVAIGQWNPVSHSLVVRCTITGSNPINTGTHLHPYTYPYADPYADTYADTCVEFPVRCAIAARDDLGGYALS